MFGALIDSLDDPVVAAGLIQALDAPALGARLFMAAGEAQVESAEFIATTVRDFLETASDDHWVQLIGIMNRAEDPGLAALRAILMKSLPEFAP